MRKIFHLEKTMSKTAKDVLELHLECFTGNGEYCFFYVKPESALIAMEEYASIKLAEKDKEIEILNARISELNKKTDDLLINIEELSNAIKKSLNK